MDDQRAVRLVLLGAPGSGKGTQGETLSSRLGVPRFSTGDILREEVRLDSELGRKAQALMGQGRLVPDDLILAMVAERMEGSEAALGFILDGFPRTQAQAEGLERMLAERNWGLDGVLEIRVPEEAVVRRLAGRWVCPDCDGVYHEDSRPSRRAGVCDRCGGRLVQRGDDRPEVVRNRLRVYQEETAPLREYYRVRGLLRPVDGQGSPEEVLERLMAFLDSR